MKDLKWSFKMEIEVHLGMENSCFCTNKCVFEVKNTSKRGKKGTNKSHTF